jgi:LacI family transcriptional regulator
MTVRDDYVIDGRMADVDGQHSGATATRSLLNVKPRPDGIFCFNDPLAFGALKELHEKGIQVPREVALVGCGNLHFDDLLRVPLSSIDQQSHRMGERAALLALDLIKSKEQERGRRILIKPTLVVRASSQR